MDGIYICAIRKRQTYPMISAQFPFRLILFVTLLLAGSSILKAQDLENIRKEKWVKANGNLGATANLYHMNGIAPRRVPFQWTVFGNVNLTIKGLALPFSFQYSEQQRDFRQPFNQFGLTPQYKWVKVYLGWRNMYFSNYTLNNHLFLGGGFELTPKKLRLGFMYGRFLKAVQEDSSKQAYNKASQYPYAAYDRFGYAAKIGYGTTNTFFDLVYFHAIDNMNSVAENPVKQLTAPSENATLGYKTRISFLKEFAFESDAAVSALTRDLRSDTLEAPKEYSAYTRLVMQPHLSTQLYLAGDASLSWKHKQWGTILKYQRIMPDYRSLGMYYTQTDLERITINPTYNSTKGTFSANLSVGTEHDNLASKKQSQTSRNIGSATIGIRPKPFYGLTLQFSNYGTAQKAMTKSVSDTTLLNQVNQSIVVTPYYTIIAKNSNHTFTLTYLNQELNDKNKLNSQNLNVLVKTMSASYSFGLNKSGWRGDLNWFNVSTEQPAGKTFSQGFGLGLGKWLLKRKLNSNLNNTVSLNNYQGNSDGVTLQTRWTNQFAVTKHNALSLNLTYTNNHSKSNVVSKSFQEYLATITFNHMF